MKEKIKMKIIVLLYLVSFVMLCFTGTTQAQANNNTEAPTNIEISGYAHANFEHTPEALTYCKW